MNFRMSAQCRPPWEHFPPTQNGVIPPHAMPQAPQFLASLSMATSHPFMVLLSQLAYPGRQESKVHTLLMHALLALGMLHCGQVQPPLAHTRFTGQTMPQPPQFLLLAPVGVSHPFT